MSATLRPRSSSATWREGDVGLKTGKGFLDYGKLDIEAYRAGRLKALVDMLAFMGLTRPPVLPE